MLAWLLTAMLVSLPVSALVLVRGDVLPRALVLAAGRRSEPVVAASTGTWLVRRTHVAAGCGRVAVVLVAVVVLLVAEAVVVVSVLVFVAFPVPVLAPMLEAAPASAQASSLASVGAAMP